MAKNEIRVPWQSKITQVCQDKLSTHYIDQKEIIREFTYEEMVFFLLMGRRPNDQERNLLRAVIVSHISHGITGQSTLAVMQAADCRSDFLHSVIAGFSVGAGSYHQGSLRATMLELQNLAKLSEVDLDNHIQLRLAKQERIMGFGHRFHKRDPRAVSLIEIVKEEGFTGIHIDTAQRIEQTLRKHKGISMNIEAACGGILLDLGFSPAIAHLIIIVGRSPMYAAVYMERLAKGRAPFQRIEVSDVLTEEDERDS
jgi:citrate synthase